MTGLSEETKASIAASSRFPGFRFSPTDEELISYYLNKKLANGFDKSVEVIPEIPICDLEPWDLPAKAVIQSDKEWFFFFVRDRKYPNGSQNKRTTELGYWKATGKERNVKSGGNVIGTKRTLVFYVGRAQKGERTEWIMHEYCTKEKSQDTLVVCRLRKNIDFHLNDDHHDAARNHRPTSHIQNNDHTSSDHRIDDMDCRVSDGNLGDSTEFSGNVHKCGKYASSDGNIDDITIRRKGKAAERYSTEFNDTCNSHYNDQNNSTYESYKKISSGTGTDFNTQMEYGNLENDYPGRVQDEFENVEDCYEDCYAEIMKDDIIDLDVSSLFSSHEREPLLTGISRAVRTSQETVEETFTQVVPLQDRSNQEKKKAKRGREAPSCFVELFFSVKPISRWFVSLGLVFVVVALVTYFYYRKESFLA